MSNHKIRVAITQGENEAAGCELLINAFAEPEMLELCTPVVYGSQKMTIDRDNSLSNCHFNIVNQAGNVLNEAMKDVQEGSADILVCGPTSKKTLQQGQPIYVNGIMRLAFVSFGNAQNAADSISQESIIEKVKSLHKSLKRNFRIQNPRIAVLALNTEAGPAEQDIIVPAISQLSENGIKVFGPYPSATFFAERQYEAFDGILAMYFDQSAPVQSLTDDQWVVVKDDHSVVCTAVEEDANTDTLRTAIYTATDIYRHQKEYDAPMGNPLPKLYHERPDSGEKLRFSIPKKREEQEQ